MLVDGSLGVRIFRHEGRNEENSDSPAATTKAHTQAKQMTIMLIFPVEFISAEFLSLWRIGTDVENMNFWNSILKNWKNYKVL